MHKTNHSYISIARSLVVTHTINNRCIYNNLKHEKTKSACASYMLINHDKYICQIKIYILLAKRCHICVFWPVLRSANKCSIHHRPMNHPLPRQEYTMISIYPAVESIAETNDMKAEKYSYTCDNTKKPFAEFSTSKWCLCWAVFSCCVNAPRQST